MSSLSKTIPLFLESLINLDNDSIKAYRLDLETFQHSFSLESVDIRTIERQYIINYLNTLQTKSFKRASVSTQNRHYATLKRFFNWLQDENHIENNPFVNIPRRKAKKDLGEIPAGSIIRSLTEEQAQQLIKNLKKANIREQALFLLIYSTGLRISEALALKTTDIQKDNSISVRSTKGNKPRKTYLSKNIKPILKKYLKTLEEQNNPQQWLFPNHQNPSSPITYARARQLFNDLTHGIQNPDGSRITIHQLRHTFATERAGYIDSILLMGLMGHSDIRTTLRYAKETSKAAQEAFEKFDQNINSNILTTDW